jgi:hypothetical protein
MILKGEKIFPLSKYSERHQNIPQFNSKLMFLITSQKHHSGTGICVLPNPLMKTTHPLLSKISISANLALEKLQQNNS